jgi:peptide/nickel transport system substrate-binding protein
MIPWRAVPKQLAGSGRDRLGKRWWASRRGALGWIGLLALALAMVPMPLRAAPEGEITWAVHTTLAPTWFDPAETPSMITPFMVMYALHDAMVKPMPDKPMAASLAESWSVSDDGMEYDFTLRAGAKFHDGTPVTAQDVKFSFERYRGTSAAVMKGRVATVEALDARHVRFKMKAPWPDFITFYASASGAGWIVPKAYVEKVGEEGYKKAPVGAGPYKFVSFNPGVELVFEAFEGYWRKVPNVKRLVFKVIPDESTRLAALKRGEVDIAYSIRGELAEELVRTPGLTLKPVVLGGTFWLYFPDQWDPKSPWHDPRVRKAASLAIDYQGISQALTLGHSPVTGSIIPDNFDFFWQPPKPAYDPAQAKKLLAEAGFPRGFDAGDYYCDSSYANLGEAVLDNLRAVGIRVSLRPLERAAFFKSYSEKKLKNLVQGSSGAFGNTATRFEVFVVKDGGYSYGGYPDIDELYAKQAVEIDRKKRGALLEQMQQLVHEKTMYAPIWQLGFLSGVGPRVAESGLGLVFRHAYSAPYEDVALKRK